MKYLFKREKNLKSMFTDQEFFFLKDNFEKRNPGLSSDVDGIRKSMRKDQNKILKLLENKSSSDSVFLVLMYKLNFLARYLGEEEFVIPDLKKDKEIQKAEIVKDEYCAVFIPIGNSNFLYYSILDIFNEPVESGYRYELYTDIISLLKSIIRGEISGIVAFHLEERFSIKSYLRYQLNHFSGSNYEFVEDYVFPPSLDFISPCRPCQIINTMLNLQEGGYQSFESLEEIVDRIFIPEDKTKIIITTSGVIIIE